MTTVTTLPLGPPCGALRLCASIVQELPAFPPRAPYVPFFRSSAPRRSAAAAAKGGDGDGDGDRYREGDREGDSAGAGAGSAKRPRLSDEGAAPPLAALRHPHMVEVSQTSFGRRDAAWLRDVARRAKLVAQSPRYIARVAKLRAPGDAGTLAATLRGVSFHVPRRGPDDAAALPGAPSSETPWRATIFLDTNPQSASLRFASFASPLEAAVAADYAVSFLRPHELLVADVANVFLAPDGDTPALAHEGAGAGPSAAAAGEGEGEGATAAVRRRTSRSALLNFPGSAADCRVDAPIDPWPPFVLAEYARRARAEQEREREREREGEGGADEGARSRAPSPPLPPLPSSPLWPALSPYAWLSQAPAAAASSSSHSIVPDGTAPLVPADAWTLPSSSSSSSSFASSAEAEDESGPAPAPHAPGPALGKRPRPGPGPGAWADSASPYPSPSPSPVPSSVHSATGPGSAPLHSPAAAAAAAAAAAPARRRLLRLLPVPPQLYIALPAAQSASARGLAGVVLVRDEVAFDPTAERWLVAQRLIEPIAGMSDDDDEDEDADGAEGGNPGAGEGDAGDEDEEWGHGVPDGDYEEGEDAGYRVAVGAGEWAGLGAGAGDEGGHTGPGLGRGRGRGGRGGRRGGRGGRGRGAGSGSGGAGWLAPASAPRVAAAEAAPLIAPH